jgi:hypothetical protein
MRGNRWRTLFLAWLCVLAIGMAIAPGLAAAQSSPTPKPKPCNTEGKSGTLDSVQQATGEGLQRKRWQPRGGVIQFTVSTREAVAANAPFLVCFRWKTSPKDDKRETREYKEVRPERLDSNNNNTSWVVTVRIPDDIPDVLEPVWETVFPLVPAAEVRIIAVNPDKSIAAEKPLLADATTVIGITYPWLAIGDAVAMIVIVLLVLSYIARRRPFSAQIKSARWPLRIISTQNGYASLSQLQIVLWTLVVAASAVYVMALSGDLIKITDGTLVLLGIAGVATLAAEAHTTSQNQAAKDRADAAQKEAEQAQANAAMMASLPTATAVDMAIANSTAANAATKAITAQAQADQRLNPPPGQKPQWSDLIVDDSGGIDVTRFQMLLFTLITAAYVLLTVGTTYAIPEIPTGFLTLMGISNGVYLGAKITQRPA